MPTGAASRTCTAQDPKIVTFCAAIWQLEAENGLIERSVMGVHYWPLVRVQVLSALARKHGLYGPSPSATPALMGIRAAAQVRDLFRSSLRPAEPRDAVLAMPEIRDLRPGSVLPIYAAGLEQDPSVGRVIALYRPTLRWPRLAPSRHVDGRQSLANDAGLVLGRLRHGRYLAAMKREKAELDHAFRGLIGEDLPLRARDLAIAASVFAEKRRLHRAVLARLQARRLYVLVGYYVQHLVAAAHDLGMEVCELQHGVITPLHLGYSYPGRPLVPYTPDQLLVFGPYWSTAADLAGGITTRVMGCHYLAPYLAAAVPKVPRRVAVISQGVIGPRLFEAAQVIAKQAPDWQFVFRCHPAEDFRSYRAHLPNTPANLELHPPQEDFSALLASSEVQIGVFSTGLFEGMRFGARTILLDLPGVDYMRDVVARGDAVLATIADVPALLANAPCARDPQSYYVAPVPSLNALCDADRPANAPAMAS